MADYFVNAYDLAWMAGIIDLKGRVRLQPSYGRRYAQIYVSVESKELDVVKQLCLMTGNSGEVFTNRDPTVFEKRGCAEHCPEKHQHVNRDMPVISRWSCSGAAAATVITNIRPYLHVDRGWDELIQRAFKETPKSGRGRSAVDSALYRLTMLGWVIPVELLGED